MQSSSARCSVVLAALLATNTALAASSDSKERAMAKGD